MPKSGTGETGENWSMDDVISKKDAGGMYRGNCGENIRRVPAKSAYPLLSVSARNIKKNETKMRIGKIKSVIIIPGKIDSKGRKNGAITAVDKSGQSAGPFLCS